MTWETQTFSSILLYFCLSLLQSHVLNCEWANSVLVSRVRSSDTELLGAHAGLRLDPAESGWLEAEALLSTAAMSHGAVSTLQAVFLC